MNTILRKSPGEEHGGTGHVINEETSERLNLACVQRTDSFIMKTRTFFGDFGRTAATNYGEGKICKNSEVLSFETQLFVLDPKYITQSSQSHI
jgi:hypothetical protein